jgi:hypothetical protein
MLQQDFFLTKKKEARCFFPDGEWDAWSGMRGGQGPINGCQIGTRCPILHVPSWRVNDGQPGGRLQFPGVAFLLSTCYGFGHGSKPCTQCKVHSVRRHQHPTVDCLRSLLCPGLQRQQDFMQWLCRFLLGCMYPGAPYERKYLAMELLNMLLEAWSPRSAAAVDGGSVYVRPEPVTDVDAFEPFCAGFLGRGTVELLMGAAPRARDAQMCVGVCLGLFGRSVAGPLLSDATTWPLLLGFFARRCSRCMGCHWTGHGRRGMPRRRPTER